MSPEKWEWLARTFFFNTTFESSKALGWPKKARKPAY
jgi:hypothetical protein